MVGIARSLHTALPSSKDSTGNTVRRVSSWPCRPTTAGPPRRAGSSADVDVELNVLGCRADILWTNCDQCVSMVQCRFASTETIRLIRTGAQDGHLDFHTAPELSGSSATRRGGKTRRRRTGCVTQDITRGNSDRDAVEL